MKRVAALAFILLLSGCGSGPSDRLGDHLRAGQGQGFNILLVSIDTMRQDRLGCYGHDAAVTPVMDALADRGIQFFDAVASAPLTLPSHTTLLTGQDPRRHGVRDNGLYALGDEPSTLTEDLRAAGYATSAFVGAFVLDARFGLDRGFDVYDFEVSTSGYRPQMADFNERPANEVTDAALAWLADHHETHPDQPFFTWVHFFDPHLPYTSPLGGQSLFRGRGYDAEIAFADGQLGRLVRWLDDSGLRERTLILVVSDHGESLGEHDEATHGMFIYGSTMKVPMILDAGGLLDRHVAVRDQLVGLVDARATLSALVGIAPTAEQDGFNLLDEVPAERTIYLETESPMNMAGCSPLYGLQTRGDKFIQAPQPEHYDLQADPDELNNLIEARREAARLLEQDLARLMGESDNQAAARDISDEEAERLRSLGYVHTGQRPAGENLPDPKEMIQIFNAGSRAEQLYSRKQYEEAAELAERVTRRCTSCISAVRVLAFSKIRLGQGAEGVQILEEAVDRTGDLFLLRSLAQARIITDDLDGALETLELFETLAPEDGRVFILRGDVRLKQGLREEAAAQFRRAREVDPHRSGIRADQRLRKLQEG